MTDNSKFQDGGFIPKEVFIEAREARMDKQKEDSQWMSNFNNNVTHMSISDYTEWKSGKPLAIISDLPEYTGCSECFKLGIICCPHNDKESK